MFCLGGFCPRTVCNGDQLFDFSVPELVWSQSMFSTEQEVLQNCASFTLCCSAGPAVGECSAVMGLTSCILCVNTGLRRPMFWKPLYLLSTPDGLAATNYSEALSEPLISSFISSKPRQHSIVFHNVLV